MARGKKKGAKKDEEKDVADSMGSLSVTESEPSTSQTSASTQPDTPAVEKPADEKPATDETKVEEEDGGLGLGLGGPKRKRPPKKKKGPASVAQQPEVSSVPAQLATGTPATPGQGPPQQLQQPPQAKQGPPPPGHGPPPHLQQPPQQWGQGPPPHSQQQSQQWGQGPPPAGHGPPPHLQQPPQQWGQGPPPPGHGPPPHLQQQPQQWGQGPPPPGHGPPPQRQPPAQASQSAPLSRPQAQQEKVSQSAPETRRRPGELVKSKFTIPAKIPGGRVPARIVHMLTNYLAMSFKPIKVYRYDFGITPERPKKMIPKVFDAFMKKNFKNIIPAFDQVKNFYSVDPLPKVTLTEKFTDKVEIKDDYNKIMKFEVSIKSTGTVDFNTLVQYMKTGSTSLYPPTETIQCVDVILRQGTLQSYVKAGRQFFRRPNNPINLGDGLEMWTGLFQSAIFTSRSFVNIDVAHKGFPIHQPMIQLIKSFKLDPSQPLNRQHSRSLDTFIDYLKGLRVVARLCGDSSAQKREYIVNKMVEPANVQTFVVSEENKKDTKQTVADYFLSKGCRLQYPNLNCLWVGPMNRTIYYPMEFLEVAYGQVRNKQLNEIQLSTMVKEAATPPNVRKKKIEEVIKEMKYKTNPNFKKFGLEISDDFTKIEGKVLNAPRIQFGLQQPAQPFKGQWRADRVLQGMALQNWGVIGVELNQDRANYQMLVNLIKSTGSQMGMSVNEPIMSQFNVRNELLVLEKVMTEAVRKNLQMLIVVVNTFSRDAYSQVKKVAEKKVGLLTQCIKDSTASRRLNSQTVRNILLKVNSKLMGVNHALDQGSVPPCMQRGNIMVVGADVTHPSPDQTSIPSIAAVTASIDQKCFKYNIEFGIQTPKKEMIVQFEDMMVDHLQMYRKEQKMLPAKIYVFRDGVSEGQFAEVMNSELQAVYNAYARLSGGKGRPEVMFLLVQKRHHTRFFLGDSAYNVEPGTVVDSLIVHPTELDFYLVSHQAIKGTARPTRYHAVCNDGKLPADEVQQLTYYLCHLYSRCSRSVSYPTPTYYAHLACLRARTLTLYEKYDNAELEKNPIRFRILPKVQEQSPMFFV